MPSRICRGSGTGARISAALTATDRLSSLPCLSNAFAACSSAASPASIKASIDAKAGLAPAARAGSGCEVEQARIALVHDSDLFLSAGFERCEFHWITPCFQMKYMIKKNIDKQDRKMCDGENVVKQVLAALAVSLALTGSAMAQAKIQVGCTATSDCASAMVAIDEGIFKKHGLEVEMTPIGINSNIPAAILSNSIQIGGPTSTVFLQAVDGGLDLVAIAGASVMSPTSNGNITAFVRNGITIKEPKDFVGKKVGAPGLNAFLHVLFVKWLVEKGVDPKGVNFVEVTFPTMSDIIKSGGVDAVLTAEPFVTRMTNAGLGSVGARYAVELARTDPIIFYAASREWADKNAAAIKKFRDAITESAMIVNDDREKASNSISKFTKQPIELVKATPPNRSEPVLKPEQLAWWIEVMSTQKMLQSKLDTSKLVLK